MDEQRGSLFRSLAFDEFLDESVLDLVEVVEEMVRPVDVEEVRIDR